MKKNILILLAVLSISSINAQKEDAVWLFGYLGGSQSLKDDSLGHTLLKFSDFGEVDIENNQDIEMNFKNTSQSICDKDGNLLFFTNGAFIMDSTFQPMMNGDSLVDYPKDDPGYGFIQNSIILPVPNQADKYAMFHCVYFVNEDLPEPYFFNDSILYVSIIDMNGNDGTGTVTKRKNIVINDNLKLSRLTATRHANGRDWWLIKNKSLTNVFYKILFSDSGIDINEQEIGDSLKIGLGGAKFSPDGNCFVIIDGINQDLGSYLNLYKFDRSTGELSDHQQLHYSVSEAGIGYLIGSSFSPNSRFLYVTTYQYVWQYDMWADDLEASKILVAEQDGYWEWVDYAKASFVLSEVAPDGKIYISTAWGLPYLHVINHPNRKGIACDVVQRAIHLPNNNDCIPNFPNFRLGPIDGSPADTLGINNNPIANFRPDQDTLNYLKLDFTDLSYYKPKTWHWTFGDGGTSDEVNPIHTYTKDGIYEVCLTVSNENSENTACTTLNLGMVANEDIKIEVKINAFPNPATDYVNLIMNDYFPRDGSVRFYDIEGRLLKEGKMRHGWNGFDVSGFPKGVVLYDVLDGSNLISSGKLICVD